MLRGIPQIPPQQVTGPDAAGRTGLRFTPGDIFRGTVIEVRGGGNVLLLARGAKIPAFATRSLQEGQNHLFQVRSQGERLVLRVLEGERAERISAVRLWASGRTARAELGRILEHLSLKAEDRGLNRTVREVLVRLRERMPGMVYRGPHGDGVKWLARQLRDSGLFLENRAAQFLLQGKEGVFQNLGTSDLKAMLLALKAALGDRHPADSMTADLANQAGRGLQLIQQDQLLNLNAWKEGLGWFWFIPGHPDEGFRGGELFVRKRDPDDEEFFLSLCLDFSLLGRMDVAVSLHRSVVNIRILAENRDAADLVNNHLDELREQLEAAGLESGAIGCRRRRRDDPPWTPFLDAAGISGAVDVVT
ncbi:MAG: flagellar hook-length control protein FliK [Thermodesulfobacteriota bacterium]